MPPRTIGLLRLRLRRRAEPASSPARSGPASSGWTCARPVDGARHSRTGPLRAILGPVPLDIGKPAWLADLVDRELEGFEPAAARWRIPPDLRDAGSPLPARARILATRSIGRRSGAVEPLAAEEAFLERAAGHVRLALEVALLAGSPFEPSRRRAELACLFAALAGRLTRAAAADPGRRGGGRPEAVRRALETAAAAFRRAAWPPGDPRRGLLISPGELALERWLLAALASDYHARGHLDEEGARARIAETGRDLTLLAEALASQATAAGRLDPPRRREVLRQVARLPLAGDLGERLRRPRGPAALARAAPPTLRPFLLEQLLLADAASDSRGAGAPFADAFAAEAGVGPDQLAAMRAEAALRAAGQLLLDRLPRGAPADWLGEGWGEAADQIAEKVAQVVTDNLDAIVTEVKQTGRLGQLLAKAAAGKALSAEEKRRVRAQLVDLAKAVPALAIFAAPGGMLLLPILAKLLPFSLLPSAWDRKRGRKRGGPAAQEPGE